MAFFVLLLMKMNLRLGLSRVFEYIALVARACLHKMNELNSLSLAVPVRTTLKHL